MVSSRTKLLYRRKNSRLGQMWTKAVFRDASGIYEPISQNTFYDIYKVHFK